ncbi:hypothetical protein [Nocardia wallacei]|uniref:hypothetical protein n=1 Tax=Nocardia wallacei TaxID=480035 RepID=UPI00245821DA|nr:hypothetical protein [Nocardia wallacei]
MSWEDLHARTEVIHIVLDRAAINPADPLIFDGIPNMKWLFGGVDGLLLALQYRWRIHLEAKIDQAASDGRPVADAEAELIAEQPALYALLTIHCGHKFPTPAQNSRRINDGFTRVRSELYRRASEFAARIS